MNFLTRDCLTVGKRRIKDVDVPTGGKARIQSLTAGEMREIRTSLVNKKGELNDRRSNRLHEILVAACLVDESGIRVFSDEDALGPVMSSIDGATLTFLFRECRNWTGFSLDSDWSAIEDATKNSEDTRSS